MVCHGCLIDGKEACGEEVGESRLLPHKINAMYISIDVGTRLRIINCFK